LTKRGKTDIIYLEIYIHGEKMDGIIIIYKPRGYTSHDAVARMKRFCQTRRIGHAGTLDPMAEGVLPILVGRACTAQEYLQDHDKSYLAGMRFGTTTDTGDITGNILSEKKISLDTETVNCAAQSFVGDIKQVPPMYSAIKVGGKRLYDLAREGITVERKARDIKIYSIEIVKQLSETDFLIRVFCSKGTYIRTLCEDIGEKLGCGGTLFSLCRETCGEFSLDDAMKIEDVEKIYSEGGAEAIEKLLDSPEKVFMHCKKIKLPAFFSKLCKNGCEIYLEKAKIKEDLKVGEMARLYDSDGRFFAVGTVSDYPDGRAVKATIRFCD
jgi:tRNA pseudouridine55 synthase